MYCEDSAGTAIDHHCPIASDAGLAYTWPNYFLACSYCNSNEKREQYPTDEDGVRLLVNPCEDDPADHLDFSPSTGDFVPRTPQGEASRDVFGLNRPILSRGRENAVLVVQRLIVDYARLREEGEDDNAARVLETIVEYPFATVAAWLRTVAPTAEPPLISADCRRVLGQYPDLLSHVA
jgi:hypothetical protein